MIALGEMTGNQSNQGNSTSDVDDLREFMIVLRRALLMLVRFIEKKYNLA